MPSNHDAIITGFPHPTISPVLEVPTYESVAEVNLFLNANAASVYSSLGDGQHGYLALTVTPAVYNTCSAVPFVAPVNPGLNPALPAVPTAAQINAATTAHKEEQRVWREFLAVDKALKQQFLGAIKSSYYKTLQDRIIRYANVTTLQILTHPYTNLREDLAARPSRQQ